MAGRECFDSHKVYIHDKPTQSGLLKWCSKCKKTYATAKRGNEGLTEMRKGFFPHLANKPEYYNYMREMPSKELYYTTSMRAKDLKEFSEWYNSQKDQNVAFNFQEEIISYCKSDVDFLRKAI